MTKNCNTCKKVINQTLPRYICVACNVHMHFEPSCTGLTQVAVNSLKEAGQLAMLLCVKCLSNKERDNFIKCRTIDKINEKIKTETQEINKKLQTMEERITAVVDTRVDNAIKTTCKKLDKSYAEAVAVQLRNIGATSKAHSREPPDLDHNIRKSIRIQGVLEDPDKSKAENFVPTTNEVNDVLKRIGVTTQITELKRLGKFSNTRKKPRTLLLTLPTEHDARLVLAKAHEKRTGVFILPALSKKDTIKENLCLKKRRELLKENVPRDKLNIRNLELFNDGKKVDLGDNHERW